MLCPYNHMGKPYTLTAEQVDKLKRMADSTLRDPALDATITGPDLRLTFSLPRREWCF